MAHAHPTGRVRRWWSGRFGYPVLVELALVATLLSCYRYGRYLVRDRSDQAFDHAHAVLRLEHHLGIGTELALQRHAVVHRWLITGLDRFYVSVHFPGTVAFLVVTYCCAPERYRHIRRLFVAVTGMGLVLHVVYPLAPPRMMPGFVDTVSVYGPSVYQRSDVSSVVNQFAAMPSLHFGWSVLVAYGIVTQVRSPLRWLIVGYPALMLTAIIVTANHYWLDAIVATLLIGVALLGARAVAAWGTDPDRARVGGVLGVGPNAGADPLARW